MVPGKVLDGDSHVQEAPKGEDLPRVQEPKTTTGSPSPSHLKGKFEDNMEIDEEGSPATKAGRVISIHEYEYNELLAEKEKYEKVLSEVTSLTLDNQRLDKELQHWKDRFLQEQSKRENFELEIQELRSQIKNSQSNVRVSSAIQDPPISEIVLRRRPSLSSEKVGLSSLPSDSESQIKDKGKSRGASGSVGFDKYDGPITSFNSTSTNTSSSSDLSLGSIDTKNTRFSSNRGSLTRAHAAYGSNSPLLIKGWFQVILFALVFFVLGRLFRP
jgi:hypothetical protein